LRNFLRKISTFFFSFNWVWRAIRLKKKWKYFNKNTKRLKIFLKCNVIPWKVEFLEATLILIRRLMKFSSWSSTIFLTIFIGKLRDVAQISSRWKFVLHHVLLSCCKSGILNSIIICLRQFLKIALQVICDFLLEIERIR